MFLVTILSCNRCIETGTGGERVVHSGTSVALLASVCMITCQYILLKNNFID